MADNRSKRALAAAERLFKRKPDASTEEFRKVCERADKEAISKLDNRELNASYVLPFRRSAAMRGKSTGKRRTKKTRGRAKSGNGRRTKTGNGRRIKSGNGRRTKSGNGRRKRKKKTTTRRGRRAGTAEDKVVQMIRERDAHLLEASGDSMKVYEIAAGVESFAAEIVKLAGG